MLKRYHNALGVVKSKYEKRLAALCGVSGDGKASKKQNQTTGLNTTSIHHLIQPPGFDPTIPSLFTLLSQLFSHVTAIAGSSTTPSTSTTTSTVPTLTLCKILDECFEAYGGASGAGGGASAVGVGMGDGSGLEGMYFFLEFLEAMTKKEEVRAGTVKGGAHAVQEEAPAWWSGMVGKLRFWVEAEKYRKLVTRLSGNPPPPTSLHDFAAPATSTASSPEGEVVGIAERLRKEASKIYAQFLDSNSTDEGARGDVEVVDDEGEADGAGAERRFSGVVRDRTVLASIESFVKLGGENLEGGGHLSILVAQDLVYRDLEEGFKAFVGSESWERWVGWAAWRVVSGVLEAGTPMGGSGEEGVIARESSIGAGGGSAGASGTGEELTDRSTSSSSMFWLVPDISGLVPERTFELLKGTSSSSSSSIFNTTTIGSSAGGGTGVYVEGSTTTTTRSGSFGGGYTPSPDSAGSSAASAGAMLQAQAQGQQERDGPWMSELRGSSFMSMLERELVGAAVRA
ncbi:hypothetical protein HK102_010742, partial [Quaeritorhiza haematococci]